MTITNKADALRVFMRDGWNGWRLIECSAELQSDRDVVLVAVSQYGFALQYASEALRNDREVVLAAVRRNDRALEFASGELRSDREFMIAAVSDLGSSALEFASGELRSDREFMIAAVSQYGFALQYASAELRNDREFILTAVSENGRALEYASEALRNDREVVLAAVRKNGFALQYASADLQADREVVLVAVSQTGWALKYASADLQADRELVLVAVRQKGCALEYASEALRNDREVVLAAVRQGGWALQFASATLKSDLVFLKAVIEINPECIECIKYRKIEHYTNQSYRQQLYGLLSPLSILSFHCGEALAQDKLMRVITGLMTLSYHSLLRASVGSDERPHSRLDFNWIQNMSLEILRYLSVKDIVRLMRTPANVYVKESDGSKRPCRHEDQPIETHRGYLGLFSWLFRESGPRYRRTSEDEANKQRYLTSRDFKVLR